MLHLTVKDPALMNAVYIPTLNANKQMRMFMVLISRDLKGLYALHYYSDDHLRANEHIIKNNVRRRHMIGPLYN